MARCVVAMMVLAALSGCGLGETAATTAALAEAEAQQARAAKEAQAKIEQRLQDAQNAAAEQRKAAESLSE